jgi:2-iminobutanoate/2-iminopropanoate deaminase
MPKQIITSPDIPAPKGPYSPAVRAAGLIFVSGQGPLRDGQVVLGPIQEQTRLVLDNIKAILQAAGSSLDKAVKTTVYLDDIQNFAAMNQIYASYFPSSPPARTTIQAANLPLGISVEIDLIALAD